MDNSSSSIDMASPATIQVASDSMALSYTLIAALALLAYDTCLTMRREIDYVWNSKFKLGTALYFLARYSALLDLSLVILVEFLTTSLQTCNGILHFLDSISLLPLISIQGLLLARTYAIAAHKRLVLIVLGVLGGFAVILSLAGSILDKCVITSKQRHIFIILGNAGTISIIVFDTVVVAVTLASTLGTWRVYKRSTWNRLTLIHLLAQQSLVRFGFVLTLTLSDTILGFTLRPTISSVLSFIQNSLSTIIICRFHLDLQRSHAHPNTSTSQGLPSISLGSFHAATQSMHDAVIAEFGDSDADEHIGTETSQEDMPTATTENDIALSEVQSQLHDVEFRLDA